MVKTKGRTSKLVLFVLIGTLLSAAACGKASDLAIDPGI